jgi:hypothetical protein
MTNSKIRTLRWIAPVAMAGVLGFAACGGEDAAEEARTEARVASRGSDTHLYNQAEEIAERSSTAGRGSDTHLYNQAEELARQEQAYAAASVDAGRGSDTHLYTQAEQLERSAIARANARGHQAELDAKLEGSAKTYGGSSVSAGNRAAMAAEAERYVEQLEANAQIEQPTGSSHDYVPGSRHMPVR